MLRYRHGATGSSIPSGRSSISMASWCMSHANGRVLPQTMYVALGVNMQGHKELLGLWLNETEGAKFWLSCLTDLKNRGLKDIFIACIDGLSGFADALHAAYPEAKVQLCVVHLVRAALKYVVDKDSDAVVTDLKKIYQAGTVLEAEQALEGFAQAWSDKYPTIVKQWRLKWSDIVAMFDFPPAIRKAIYTTNAIESVNSVIRKFTRNRKQYPNEESAQSSCTWQSTRRPRNGQCRSETGDKH